MQDIQAAGKKVGAFVSDPYAGIVELLDTASNGRATKFFLSQGFTNFAAGWYGFWDSTTGGLTTRMLDPAAAQQLQNNDYWLYGQVAGAVTSIALAFVNPCGAASIVSLGIRGLNLVSADGGHSGCK